MEGGNNMNTIDQRIVEMQFNNKQFENGVQTSLKTLDNLKNGLKLEGASKGLINLENMAKRFSLANISSSVDAIASRFTNLGIIGVTALQNLTNSAINYGKRIVSALTIDPIADGYADYGRKLTSMQTIMNATGKSGEEVEKYFNELDTYADKTIYNLNDMTSAFAKFTNAGVDLDKSVPAIKGIANMVALAGQDAGAASMAMYNLSQSIAGGFLTTMDYKSLNLANVATREWKDQMIAGAIAAGTLKKTSDGMYQISGAKEAVTSAALFNDELSKGWATTTVLLDVLGKYGDVNTDIGKKAQSAAQDVKSYSMMMETLKASVGTGWTDTFEILIGNLEESKVLFTGLTNFIGGFLTKMSDARNAMLSFWKDNDGRYDLIEALLNTFKGIQEVLGPITEAFNEIFPPLTGEKLVAFTRGLRDLTRNFKISDETAANIKRTFKGLFAILDIGRQAFVAIAKGVGSIVQYLLPAGDGLLSFTGNLGDFLVSLNEAIKRSGIFTVAIQKICDVIKIIAKGITLAINMIVDVFKSLGSADLSGLDSFSDHVSKSFKPLTTLGAFVHNIFSKIAQVVEKIAPAFFKVANVVGNAFDRIRTNIMNALQNAGFNSILDVLNGGLFAAILFGIKKFIKSLNNIVDKNGKGFLGTITEILDGVQGSLKAWQTNLKAKTLVTIAIAIGILSASLLALSTIDPAKLTASMAAMTVMFVELFASMAIFEKIMGSAGFKSMGRVTRAMIGLSIAVLILSVAMTKLAKLDWNGIAKGLVSVAALSAILVKSAQALSNGSKGLVKGALGLILFAAAINILATAVKKLGAIDTKSLAKGLISVGVLCAELALFMKISNFSGMGIGKGLGLLSLAAAILVLAVAVEKFSNINASSLIKGLGAVAIVLTQLALFVNLTGDSKKVISTAIGLTILGIAINIFAAAIGAMGSLSIEQLAKGLFAMATSLAIIVVALNLLPKGIILQAAGLVVLSTALVVLAGALFLMGQMSLEQVAKSLIALAGSLTIITVAMMFMKTALPGAAALLVISGALAILAPVLVVLGNLSLAEIGKGLLALAGAFAIIGVAGLVLAPLIPSLIGLSISIALLGVSCLAVGAGLLLFSTGLAALAVSGAAGAAALVVVVTSIVGLIPFILKTIAVGIVEFAKVIGNGAPIIAKAVVQLINAYITVMVQSTPKIIAALFKMLDSLLNTLITYIPKISDAGMKIIIGFLKGIASNIKDIVVVAIDIAIKFINGISSMLPKVIQAGAELIISFINGLANAIRKNTDPLIAAMKNLVLAVVDAAIKVFFGQVDTFLSMGGHIIGGLITGIKNSIYKVVKCIGDLGQVVIKTFANLLGIHSDSDVFISNGGYVIGGFVTGIKNNTPKAEKAVINFGKSVTKAGDKAFNSKGSQTYGLHVIQDLLKVSKEQEKVSKEQEKVTKQSTKVEVDSNNKKKASVKDLDKVRKEAYDKEIERIEDKKYYNQMNLKQELATWQTLQKKYKEGSDERKKADREVYRLKQEIIKDEFDKSVSIIDERKYYNKLSLTEELAAWVEIQNKYKAGTEERKRADREVYRVKQELTEKKKALEDDYYQKTKEINDKLKQDIQSLTDEYDQALVSRTDALYRSYGLFDKLEVPEAVSGTELINNLQGQVVAFDNWQKNINELSKKGISGGLLKELQDMGPSATDKIQALNQLSQPELDKFVTLWQQKSNQAKTKAISELEGMRIENLKKINQLHLDTSKELEALKITYKKQLALITTNTQTQLVDFNSKWNQKTEELKGDNKKAFDKITADIQNSMKTPDWVGLGKNIINGITQGVNAQAAVLATATASAAQQALISAKKTLGIKSPSIEFAKVGKYSMEGFAGGLKTFASLAVKEAVNAGTLAKESLKNTVANISDSVSTNIDSSPTIRPVLDLSNIEAGKTGLNKMFDKQRIGLSTSMANNKVSTIATSVNMSKANVVDIPTKKMEPEEVIHSGSIKVEGVNDMNQLIGAVEVVIENSLPRILRREVRMA
jgi:hypothetical protein